MNRLLFIAALLAAPLALAEGLNFESAWARATPPGLPMGAVYMQVHNPTAEPIHVVDIRSSVAGNSEIHASAEVDGLMRMRRVDPFVVQPGETVLLEPGGKHIMLTGLAKALVEGTVFTLTLVDSSGDSYIIEVQVGGFGQLAMPEKR